MVTERFLQRECPRCKVSDHFTEVSRAAIREEELLTLGPTGPGLRRVVWHNILRAATAHEGVLAKLAARRVAGCLLYTSPSPRDRQKSRMPSSA